MGRVDLRSEDFAGWNPSSLAVLLEQLQKKKGGGGGLTKFNLRPISKLIARGEKKEQTEMMIGNTVYGTDLYPHSPLCLHVHNLSSERTLIPCQTYFTGQQKMMKT